jgi:hypothetical protein
MKKFICLEIIIFSAIFLISCASNPRFKGAADFCGMVVNEKNEPVNEYFISCRKDGLVFASALTNQSGIFVLQNIPSGKYSFDGQKENYSDIKNLKVDFCFRDKFLCCTVFTADGVFERLKGLAKMEDYDTALDQLNLLRCKNGTYVSKVALCYEAWLYALKKDSKSTLPLIKKIRKLNEPDFGKFADELEVMLNEKNAG